MQDNNDMTYYRDALKTNNYSAVADTLNNDVIPTDVTLLPENTSPNGNTDAVYNDVNRAVYCGFDWHPETAGDGMDAINGLAECITLSGDKCQRFDVHFDTSYTDGLDHDGATALACHETGHSLGLAHVFSDGGCMKQPLPLNDHEFDSHDITHLNNNY